MFAYVRDASPTNDSFHAYSVPGTGGSVELTIPALPKGSTFICDVFNGTEADLMFWAPGGNTRNVRHISPSGPGWNLTTNQVFNVGFPVAQLAAVNTPAGKRLIIRYENGSVLEVTYNGTNLDTPNYIPTNGMLGMASGVVPMARNNFQLLYSPGPGTSSTNAVAFSNSGSGWVAGTTATLPVLKRNCRSEVRQIGDISMLYRKLLFTALLVLTLAAGAAAQAAWSPEMQTRVTALGSPRVSPDGKRIVYTVANEVMTAERSEYVTQIWLANTDGTANNQITFADKTSTNPKWSPDGNWLAFTSTRKDNKSNIYVFIRTAGGEAEQITDVKGTVSDFEWSPDGKSLALQMTDPKTDDEEKNDKARNDFRWVDGKPKDVAALCNAIR